MQFTDFVPREMMDIIIPITKIDWFEAEECPDNPNGFRVRVAKSMTVECRDQVYGPAARYLKLLQDGRALNYLNAIGHLYRDGFKVLRPTIEQCESMEEIDLPIQVGDIKAPFPTFAVDLPQEYRDSITHRFGACPNAMMFHQGQLTSGKTYILVGGPYSHPEALKAAENIGSAEYFYLMHDNGLEVEKKLKRYIDDDRNEISREELAKDSGYLINEVLTRLVINLALVATHFGVTRPQPSNPKHVDRLRRRCQESESARIELKSTAKYFELDQKTVIREIRPHAAPQGGSHASPRPHWRRGHWRAKQGYGKARAAGESVPLVFIRPIQVRAEAFLGELSQTTAEYTMR